MKIDQWYAMRAAWLGSLGENERGKMANQARKWGAVMTPLAPTDSATVVYASRRGVAPSPKLTIGRYINPASTLYKEVSDAAAAVGPAVVAGFEKHFTPLAFRGFRNWPVWSGYSRAALSLRYYTTNGYIGAEFVSEAPYTKFIGAKGRTTDREGNVRSSRSANPWEEEVRKPSGAAWRAFTLDLPSDYVAYARKVR